MKRFSRRGVGGCDADHSRATELVGLRVLDALPPRQRGDQAAGGTPDRGGGRVLGAVRRLPLRPGAGRARWRGGAALLGLALLSGCGARYEPAIPLPRAPGDNSVLVPITPPPEDLAWKPDVPSPAAWEEYVLSPVPADAGAPRKKAAPPRDDAVVREVGAVKHFAYKQGGVYTIPVGVDGPTWVILPPGERLAMPVYLPPEAYEKVLAQLGAGEERREAMMLRALTPQSAASTGFLFQSGKMLFARLVPQTRGGITAVTWDLPAQPPAPKAPAAPVASRPPLIDVSRLYTRYALESEGKFLPPWMPRRVFDDGARTYIEFQEPLTHTRGPAVTGVHPHGKEGLVQGSMYTVPGRPERGAWLLVNGLWPALTLNDGHGMVVKVTREPLRGEGK